MVQSEQPARARKENYTSTGHQLTNKNQKQQAYIQGGAQHAPNQPARNNKKERNAQYNPRGLLSAQLRQCATNQQDHKTNGSYGNNNIACMNVNNSHFNFNSIYKVHNLNTDNHNTAGIPRTTPADQPPLLKVTTGSLAFPTQAKYGRSAGARITNERENHFFFFFEIAIK